MAEEFKGLSQEQIDKIDQYKASAAEIYKSYSDINAQLKDAVGAQDKLGIGQFRSVNITKDIAKLQKEAISSTKAVANLEKKKSEELAKVVALEAKKNNLLIKAAGTSGKVKELFLKQAENLANAADQAKFMAEAIGEVQKDAAKLNNSTKFFTSLSSVIGDIPGLRKLSGPFDAAAKASKEAVLSNAKLKKGSKDMKSPFAAGMKGFGKSLSGMAKAFGPAGIIATALKLIFEILKGANAQAVDLGRSMGTSVQEADNLRARFVGVRKGIGESRANLDYLIEAQKDLNSEFGATFGASQDILNSQTFLTKRLMMSSNEAAGLNLRMNATGEAAYGTLENINNLNRSFAQTNGFGMSMKQLMGQVAGATGQVAASFGFSNEAIAKGVLQVRRFGVNLQQASNVASNLLDFEQSIGAELEAELLTGQQFNLERARAKAATGDIAGATADVLSQMQNLTAEQRRSPIIMEAIAKATGLSADELQKAYLIQGNNKVAAEEYYRVLREGDKQAIEDFKTKSGLDKATMAQIEARKTLEEDFAEAMKDLKQQFVGLAKGGTLQSLGASLKKLIKFIGFLTGTNLSIDEKKKIADLEKKGMSSEEARRLATASSGPGVMDYLGLMSPGGLINLQMKKKNAEFANKKIAANMALPDVIKPDDFTIRQNPKDTLVMAGGTQFGKETNGLLRQLISAVEGGKVINLEGRKVGETLVMSSYKS
jgi:hypothetical protein